jgi:protein phosphatase
MSEENLPVEKSEVATVENVAIESAATENVEAVAPVSELQPPASSVAALPEGDWPQPPRPLVPGAFLAGEYEIKELLSRGVVNFYLAHGGDYMQPTPFLVTERELPQSENAPDEKGSDNSESDPSAGARDESTPTSPLEETEAAIIATLGESEAEPASESTPAIEEVTPRASLQSPLFPTGHDFVQDGREYFICEWQETNTLQDWREPTNDARYLRAVSTLLQGASELEDKNLTANFSRDVLRFDDEGELKYFGFVDRQPENTQPPASNLQPLQEINSFLLKHVFAESSTMRLDDEWSGLALSEEVKAFATKISDGDFENASEAFAALPQTPTGVLRAQSVLLSDVGQEREVNEDSGMILRVSRAGHMQNVELELYAVADGMGGHEGGEVASDLTLNALQNSFLARSGLNWNDNIAVRAALWEIIEEVNNAVLEMTEGPQYRSLRNKPGATLVFAVRIGAALFIGNVGDSRGYMWDETADLVPITKDHSYVQSLIDSGQLDPADAWGHPDGSIITAHIGMQKLKQRDVYIRLAKPGAKLLLVSDGVVDMLRDEQIAPYLQEENPALVCKNLVDASNAAGGFDNITVVCVDFK